MVVKLVQFQQLFKENSKWPLGKDPEYFMMFHVAVFTISLYFVWYLSQGQVNIEISPSFMKIHLYSLMNWNQTRTSIGYVLEKLRTFLNHLQFNSVLWDTFWEHQRSTNKTESPPTAKLCKIFRQRVYQVSMVWSSHGNTRIRCHCPE